MAASKQTTGFDAFGAMNPEVLKEGYEKLSKNMSSFAEFQKGSMEALMECATAYARGLEQAASEQTTFLKEVYEEGTSATKAASTAKSVQEAIEIHSDFARTAFEKNINFASKLAEHWTGVARTAADPLSKKYGEFVDMVQSYRP